MVCPYGADPLLRAPAIAIFRGGIGGYFKAGDWPACGPASTFRPAVGLRPRPLVTRTHATPLSLKPAVECGVLRRKGHPPPGNYAPRLARRAYATELHAT